MTKKVSRIKRIPIKIPDFLKPQIKLWEVMEETREEDIYAISRHFDMLMMKATHKAGHNSLSLINYKKHRNWIHFERVYEICRIKGWDTNLYIEAQFERAKGWEGYKFPRTTTLYSDNALRYFTNFISTREQMYKQDTNKDDKMKGKATKSITDTITDEVARSAKLLSDYINSSKQKNLGEYKALQIYQRWAELSPYYLYSVPWFHDVINEIDSKLIERYRLDFETISKSPMMQNAIKETIQQVDEFYNLPENINF